MLVGWGFGGAGAPGRAGVGSLQEAPTWKACVGLQKVGLERRAGVGSVSASAGHVLSLRLSWKGCPTSLSGPGPAWCHCA